MEFCRSADSKKTHIREDTEHRRPICGGGGWGYGAGFETVEPDSDDWPMTTGDICKTCRTNKRANAFLIGVEMRKAPEAVTSCIYVDINLPTKSEVLLSEAVDIMDKVKKEVEKFAAMDATGVCVKFNLKEY